MITTDKIVTIFGGSGFVGRYIAQRMAKQGWRVRVAVRRPNEAMFVRPYGVVGQVEPILANIRDDASTRAAIEGSDAVINCVGILFEDSRQSFDAVQTEGAERIAGLSAEAGVQTFVHLSAIGADAESDSDYARTKAEGEAAVLRHMPNAAILRPSIVFGNEDQFFNRFADMARFSPFMPLVGADTVFQPVFVDDVAAAAERAVVEGHSGVFELGGPDVAPFRRLIEEMLHIVRRNRVILPVPSAIGHVMGAVFEMGEAITFGMVPNRVLTRDQVRQLGRDNVVSGAYPGFEALGITPRAMDGILESYLYSYRPYGQYTELTESAEDLRT